jgi:hypothetical protein
MCLLQEEKRQGQIKGHCQTNPTAVGLSSGYAEIGYSNSYEAS